MKTLVDYRHRAAQLIKLYRWQYYFYKKGTIEINIKENFYHNYLQIGMLYECGLISVDCAARAYYMYACIRNKYLRGVIRGGNK